MEQKVTGTASVPHLRLSFVWSTLKSLRRRGKKQTYELVVRYTNTFLVAPVLCNTFIPACPSSSGCFVFKSNCCKHISDDNEVNQDLHWKLTTHFLPAMPRKYFSVRSHTSCSSGRDERRHRDVWKDVQEYMCVHKTHLDLKLLI